MSPASPRVSVVIPARNASKFLGEALRSVLVQSFSDMEVLVIDDGSTDDTVAVAQATRDCRVRVIRLDARGIPAALNRGIAESKAEFVVRMDADDVCLPRRLETQVRFMDSHPEVGVCGSWVELDYGRSREIARYPPSHEGIVCAQLFRPGLAHPAAVIRRRVLENIDGPYDEAFPYAQDYALWTRLVLRTRFANVPQVLLRYRAHPASVWGTKRAEQLRITAEIWRAQVEGLGLAFETGTARLHAALAGAARLNGLEELDAAEGWLRRLSEALVARRGVAAVAVHGLMAESWILACAGVTALGPAAAMRYWASPFADRERPFRREHLRLLYNCFLRRA